MNNEINECHFNVCGQEFVIRPTFKIISRIESANGLGRSMLKLTTSLADLELTVVEMAKIIHCAIKDETDAPSLNEIGESLVSEGFHTQVQPLTQFLTSAFRGSRELTDLAEENGELEEDPLKAV